MKDINCTYPVDIFSILTPTTITTTTTCSCCCVRVGGGRIDGGSFTKQITI